jgi:hypothetical protein
MNPNHNPTSERLSVSYSARPNRVHPHRNSANPLTYPQGPLGEFPSTEKQMSTSDSSPELDSLKEANIFAALQAWDKAILSRTEIGIMCRDVRDGMLWKYRIDPETNEPCTNWTRWMHLAAPRAYSTAHQYLREVIELKDIPDEHLSQIRGENVDTVIQLSTAVRKDPDVLEAAKTQPVDGLIDHIRDKHPGQAIEHRKTLKFNPEESAVKVINNALDEAIEHGARDRDSALEMLAVIALQNFQMEREVESAYTDTPSTEPR